MLVRIGVIEMGSCDHSILVGETDLGSLCLAPEGAVKDDSVDDIGQPLCQSSNSVPAEVGKVCLEDSLSEEGSVVVPEKQLCSELTKELCSDVAFAVSNSSADPAGAIDSLLHSSLDIVVKTPMVKGDGLEGPAGAMGSSQHSSGDIEVETPMVKGDGLEGPAGAMDGSQHSSGDIEVETPMVKRDGLEGEDNNVGCLVLEGVSHNECGVGGFYLHDNHVESEGLCLEEEVFFDVSEIPLNSLLVTGSLSNCGEQMEQKDTKRADGGVAEKVMEIGEVKSDLVKTHCCQEFLEKSCELPPKLLGMACSLSNQAKEEIDQDGSNSISGFSGKYLTEAIELKGDVDTSSQVLPYPCGGKPAGDLHSTGSPGNCVRHVEQNDSSSTTGNSSERVLEVGLERSGVESCTSVLFSQSNHAQKNEQESISGSGGPAVRVMELLEDKKDNFINGIETEKYTLKSPIEEHSRIFKEESFTLDCAVEKLVTPVASQPFSIVSNGPSKRLDISDCSETGAVIGGLNSSIPTDCFERADTEGRDKSYFDSILEAKISEHICTSSRRSSSRSKLSRESQTRKVSAKNRKKAKKVPHSYETIEIFSMASRRKRSCSSKPARSSTWGFLGNISQFFEQNNQLDVDHVLKQGSKARKTRCGRGSRKHNQSQEDGKLLQSNGKHLVVKNRIRLKVKVGKEVDQNSLKVMTPEEVNTSAPGLEVIGDYRHECGTGFAFSKPANGLEDKLGEEVHQIRQLQCIKKNLETVESHPEASYLDAHLADAELESTVTLYNSARNDAEDGLGISTIVEVEVEARGEGIENRYLDPGTSPDSEVINQIPDPGVGASVQDDLLDAIMSSSGDLIATGNVKSLDLPHMSSKKGRKKDKFSAADSHIMDPLCGPASLTKPQPSKKIGHEKKLADGFNSDETFTPSASRNASNNTSSNEELSGDQLPLSNDVELTCGSEDKLFGNPDLGIGSIDSENAEKLLPSSKTMGHKSSTSLKSSGVSKSKSEVPDTARRVRENACKQKESRRKSVNKSKSKEKGVSDRVFCKVESGPEIDDTGKTDFHDKAVSEEKCDLDIVTTGLTMPSLPPRNAWVSCDDCQKWRRIPAILADHIEETNGKWTCKDNMDKSFADCSIPQEKSNADINAELEISDASCEEGANVDRYNSKGLERRQSTVSQQSSWRLTKSNLFLHRSRKTQTIDEVMVCHCKPSRSGCGDECLNRILNIECVQGTCPCGDLCTNQQFQKKSYAKLKHFRCGKKGFGLQLLEDISKGQFLIEYVGEVLDLHAYKARQMEYASRGHKHFYFMTLNGSEVIDACAKGNLGRFINHSCNPNCRTEKWLVNGEICIGLFAIRNIKKGEEVTFDYNYVRVFGAAAKKCVCGSSQCRGYIGGDPLSTEVIVQGDSDEEYPEPVMVLENGETVDSLDDIIPTTSACINDEEMQTAEASKNRDLMDESAVAVARLEISTENDESTPRSSLVIVDSSGKLTSSGQLVEVPLQTEDITSKPTSTAQQEITMQQKAINNSLYHATKLETSLTLMPEKSLSDSNDASKKSQSGMVEQKPSSKSHSRTKASHSSTSVKKGKHKSNPVSVNRSQLMTYKPKKVLEGSDNGRFEAVEEKLNELLDADGGISKRKDASKGYLKLLLLTAASGDSGNGEGIQSNRDLSMILDALLKTKSRMVLVDIINKNGLRMLHNIMKQYRKDFNRIPILRKLLKILEHWAEKEILSFEHINGGPPCPGMESFRESILTLTEHSNKQVHQIARNFRDKWIPRPSRKINCMERDDGRMESYKGSNCSRFSASHNYWRDQGVKANEAIDCIKQSVVPATHVASTQEECSALRIGDLSTNGTKIRKRKRKSRWDEPAETNPDFISVSNEEKSQPGSLQERESSSQPEMVEVVLDHKNRLGRKEDFNWNHSMQNASDRADDGGQSMLEDVPPGFSSPIKTSLVSSSSTSSDLPGEIHHSNCPEMVTGHPQERFISRLPVSYGIPLSILQQFGTPEAESVGNWILAPGIAFHPFPPLPPCPRDGRKPSSNSLTVNQAGEVQPGSSGSATYHMDQSTRSTSGASPMNVEAMDTGNQDMRKRAKGSSYDLGKRFRQQKWNNTKVAPPWLRRKNGWGFNGSNSRNGMYNVGNGCVRNEHENPSCSDDVSNRMENPGSTFYQHPQHHNQH